MDTLVVRIPADGKTAEGLYSDLFPWNKIGELDIRRASDVKFNNDIKRWEVFLQNTDKTVTKLPETWEKRADAIDYEIRTLQGVS